MITKFAYAKKYCAIRKMSSSNVKWLLIKFSFSNQYNLIVA